MPLFEFTCPRCGLRIEKLMKRPEPLTTCPDCGGPAERRVSLFSAAGPPANEGCRPAGSGFG